MWLLYFYLVSVAISLLVEVLFRIILNICIVNPEANYDNIVGSIQEIRFFFWVPIANLLLLGTFIIMFINYSMENTF